MTGSEGRTGRDSYPIWVAMGAAFVGTLLGGAAVWIGLSGRGDPTSDTSSGAPPVSVEPPVPAEIEPPGIAAEPSAEVPESPTLLSPEPVDPGDSPLVRAIGQTRDSVVSLEIAGSVRGAGVVFDPEGALLTNFHVIEPALRAQAMFGEGAAIARPIARFADGRARAARIVAADPDEDIAVLKLEREVRGEGHERFAAAPVGESAQLRLGEQVFAIGSPVGFEATVATGIVSALARTQVLANRQLPLIQLDAAINFGNSGGPLFNLRGELVGITTARSSRGEGIGFAIPIDRIRLFLRAIDEGTRGRAGMVGVEPDFRAEIEAVIAPLGYHSGVTVAAVDPDRPAAKAGLRAGDVLVAIRGRRYDELDASLTGRFEFARLFGETIRGLLPGETIAVTVVRPGSGQEAAAAEVVELELTVEAASVVEQARIDSEELLGLVLDPDAEAPVVVDLIPGSPISRVRGAAILRGATIVSIVQQPVDSLETLGGRLSLLRDWTVGGGQRRIAIGFRGADGRAIETSAYPLRTGE